MKQLQWLYGYSYVLRRVVKGFFPRRSNLILGVLTFTTTLSSAATIYSTSSGGDWNTASTWVGGIIPGASDDLIIVSTATVTLSASPANQTGGRTLTINGTLSLAGNGSINLLNYSQVTVSGTNSQIYWQNNADLHLSANTGFDINSPSLGCQPTGGSASSALWIGTIQIAVANSTSNNAAFSFAQFNAAGGLPQFVLSASPSSMGTVCYGTTFSATLTPTNNITSFDCAWSVNNAATISPSSVSNFTTAQTAAITPPVSASSKNYTVTCNVYRAGDADLLASYSVIVTVTAVNAIPVVAAIGGGSASVCVNASTPAFTNATAGGSWSIINGTGSASVSAAGVVTGLTAGNVSVVYTYNSGGCSNTATKALTVNALPVVAAIGGGAASVCVNAITPSFTNATAGGSWSITNGTGSASISAGGVVTGLTAGNVTIVYTYSNGTCSKTATKTLTVNALPAVAAIGGGSSAVCVNGTTPSFTNATSGGSWSVTNGTGTASISAAAVVTGLSAGNVTVVYTYNNGTCSNTATKALTVNALPVVAAIGGGAAYVCVNANTPAFTDATSTGSWSISNGTGTASINAGGVATGLTAGNATVVYTYNNGVCSNTATKALTINPLPAVASISGGSATVCVNALTPAFTNTTTGGSWTVSNGTGTGSITAGGVLTGLTAGSVTVVYTYSNGTCSNTANAPITINTLPALAAIGGGSSAVCINASTPSFTNSTTGGTWSLTNGTGNASITAAGVVAGLSAGNATVVYSYNNGSCSNSVSTPLTINSLPVITGASSVCAGSSITLSGTATADASTPWTSSNTGVATVNTGGLVSGISGGSTIITYKNNNGCTTTSPITVTPVTPGTAYWTGTVSTDWCNSGNWACGVLPDANTNAVILASAPNYPIINCANESVKDIDLQGSSTLGIPLNRTFGITGSIINSNPGQYTLSGTVNFSGGNQTIPAFTYNGLTISGSGTISKTLSGPVTVNGDLTLSNGILVTRNSSMLTVSSTGSITGYSNNSYIQGPLTRITNSTGAYVFPTGNSSLRVTTITPSSASAGSYTVYYHPSSPTISSVLANIGGVQVNEYWDITRGSGPDVVISLDYVNPGIASAWSSNTNPCATCNVAIAQGTVYSGNTNWDFAGSSGGFSPAQNTFWQTNGTVSSRPVSSFGQFAFAYAYSIILPVSLEYFKGKQEGKDSRLWWKFADVTGLAETLLEESEDGIHYHTLAHFPGDKSQLSYTYELKNVTAGSHYYRLKMAGHDGNITFSKVLLLSNDAGISRFNGIRPTVVTGEAYIDLFSATSQHLKVSILDVNGRLVYAGKMEMPAGENHYRFNAGGFARGWYYVRLACADGKTASYRFVKE